MRLCLIPRRRVPRNRKQFIATRRRGQALISWWRSITGLEISGEGGPEAHGPARAGGWRGAGARDPSRARRGSLNEALMRGARRPLWRSSLRRRRPGRALREVTSSPGPMPAIPWRASCGHQAGRPLRALLGPRHPRRPRIAAGNAAFPCNNANALITISSICMKKTREAGRAPSPGSGLGIQ